MNYGRVISGLKGGAVGVVSGAVFVLSQLPQVTPLTVAFSAATVVNCAVVLGMNRRHRDVSIGDAVVGASGGICAGMAIMGAVHTAEVATNDLFGAAAAPVHYAEIMTESLKPKVCEMPLDGPPPSMTGCTPR